ncbi:MAG: hypothetical protein QW794_00415 [Thermosphaera sp.]
MFPRKRYEYKYEPETPPAPEKLEHYSALTRNGLQLAARQLSTRFPPVLHPRKRTGTGEGLPNLLTHRMETLILEKLLEKLSREQPGWRYEGEKVRLTETTYWKCRSLEEERKEEGKGVPQRLECAWGVKYSVSNPTGTTQHRGFAFALLDCLMLPETGKEEKPADRVICAIKRLHGYSVPIDW